MKESKGVKKNPWMEEEITLDKLKESGAKQMPSYFNFRIGWCVNPDDPKQSLHEILMVLAKMAHFDWIEAMNRGEVPCEDVSPGEGFQLMADTVRELLAEEDGKTKCGKSEGGAEA